jgi:maleylacetoacetate isomerase
MPDAPTRELVLYAYWRSSASYRVRLALAAKKLPHRIVPVNILSGEQNAEPHLSRSPTGYVPSLVIDGTPFFESIAILELLEELYPAPPIYPRDPFGRARVRALVELVASGIQPLQNLNVTQRLPGDTESRNEWVRHFITKGLAAFERAIAANEAAGVTGRFAYGDTLTAADLVLIPQMNHAKRFHVDLTAFPKVVRADASACAVPGLDAASPERQPDAPMAG